MSLCIVKIVMKNKVERKVVLHSVCLLRVLFDSKRVHACKQKRNICHTRAKPTWTWRNNGNEIWMDRDLEITEIVDLGKLRFCFRFSALFSTSENLRICLHQLCALLTTKFYPDRFLVRISDRSATKMFSTTSFLPRLLRTFYRKCCHGWNLPMGTLLCVRWVKGMGLRRNRQFSASKGQARKVSMFSKMKGAKLELTKHEFDRL